jgi:hypothetical protein
MQVSVFPRVAFSSRALQPLRFRVSGLLLLVVSALSCPVLAQSNPESQNQAWDLSVWAAGATGEENTNSFSEAGIFSAAIFVGHAVTSEIGRGWRRGTFEFGADFVPIFVQFTPQRISGTAFDPVILRWNSSLHHGRGAAFVELGGGAIHTRINFPQGDTSTFNFMARAGGGILISTRHAQALEIACRWWHISNANLGTRNPEFNGIQVSVGWHWFK